MKEKYEQPEEDNEAGKVNDPAMEYQTEQTATYLHVHSLEEVQEKLVKSEEDLAKGIYISHEDMKKRHLL